MAKIVTALELDTDYCSRTFNVPPCRAGLGYAPSVGRTGPYAARFDGSLDYMTRGGNLTGAADGKVGTLSCWLNVEKTDGVAVRVATTSNMRFFVARTSTNKLRVLLRNAAGTDIGDFSTSSLVTQASGWVHLLASWDLAAAALQMYLNDVSDITITVNTNDTIDYTDTDFAVGAEVSGANKFHGRIAELWASWNTRVDLSVEANRRLFIDSNRRPVYLGATGEIPLGSAPIIFFSGLVEAFHTNKGTGGGMTLASGASLTEQILKKHKCFNTLSTCGDTPNFDDESATFIFAKRTPWFPTDVSPTNDSLIGVQLSPARLSIGESLGKRASMTATFQDRPHSDTAPAADKYSSERTYVPFDQGTFFGKFAQRHKFLRGDIVRWITGRSTESYDEMEARTFIVDSYNGPDRQGKYTITAKDPLKFLDGDRAQIPLPNTGFLVADITSVATTATLSPAGVGDLEYPVSGYANIGGEEIVVFVRDPYTKLIISGDGTDGSTSFPDLSTLGHVITAVGSAQVDTAQSKFGGASALLGAAGNYLSVPDSADWNLSNGNFTVSMWVRFVTAPSGAPNSVIDNALFFQETGGGANRVIAGFDGTDILFLATSASVNVAHYTATHGIANNTWAHLEFVRSGTSFFIFKDGTALTLTTVTAISTNTLPDVADVLHVGGVAIAGPDWVDDFVWRKGVADHTTNFTPPTAAATIVGAGDVITLTRGQLGTTPVAHVAQDRVQRVYRAESFNPALLLWDMLVNYAGVDPAFIPLSSWQAEVASNFGAVFTGTIANPMSVREAANEVIEQAALVIWWDDLANLLRLQVVKAISTEAQLFDESKIVVKSVDVQEQPDLRLSQVWTYFALRDPLTSLTDDKNYRSVAVKVDAESEDLSGQPMLKKVYSRWIPTGGRATADRLNDLLIARYKSPPRLISFSLPRHRGVQEVSLGGGYRIQHHRLQDETGESVPIPVQVVQLDPRDDVYNVIAVEMLFDLPLVVGAERQITIDSNQYNISFRTLHDANYPAPTGTETVRLIIETGVIVGSTTVLLPALDVGSWPTGQPLIVEVRGRLQGRGGDGGNGAVPGSNGSPGVTGGTALYTRKAVTLILNVGSGEVWGGGGGGGGGGANFLGGGGGGGGAGKDPGLGGAGNFGSNPGLPGTTELGGASGSGGALGGVGGNPGLAGQAGFSSSTAGGAAGGAGNAVDGHSLVTYTGTGDKRGGQVN